MCICWIYTILYSRLLHISFALALFHRTSCKSTAIRTYRTYNEQVSRLDDEKQIWKHRVIGRRQASAFSGTVCETNWSAVGCSQTPKVQRCCCRCRALQNRKIRKLLAFNMACEHLMLICFNLHLVYQPGWHLFYSIGRSNYWDGRVGHRWEILQNQNI